MARYEITLKEDGPCPADLEVAKGDRSVRIVNAMSIDTDVEADPPGLFARPPGRIAKGACYEGTIGSKSGVYCYETPEEKPGHERGTRSGRITLS